MRTRRRTVRRDKHRHLRRAACEGLARTGTDGMIQYTVVAFNVSENGDATRALDHQRLHIRGVPGTLALEAPPCHAGRLVLNVEHAPAADRDPIAVEDERAIGVAACPRRCCTNRHGPARCSPTGSSRADAIRHWSAESGHPIEDLTAEDDFTPLPGWAPGAKTSSDDGRVAEERVLHPALTMGP